METGYNMGRITISCLIILCIGVHRGASMDILQRQKRDWIIDSFTIEEESKGPFPYALEKLPIEKKFRKDFKLHGHGVDQDPIGLLKINTETGQIFVNRKIDYEQYQVLKLTLELYDLDKNALDTRLGIEVQISDINDNTPIFIKELYEVSIKEFASQGTFLLSVAAKDKDNPKTDNGTFDLRIVSVTPKPSDFEFFITQKGGIGTIAFKGCLDYEKAEKYTILVEAKDRGDQLQLSSTCTVIVHIEDGNNHHPVFTGQTVLRSIKEGENNVSILRLHVSDKDAKGTAAWKAKYNIIHGNAKQNFRIDTDPDTNDGVLYVEKHLDFEEGSQRNLTISVENEVPYYSCKVQSRPSTGVWNVLTVTGEPGTRSVPPLATRQVTVDVEDVNDPPVFTSPVKDVVVEENVAVGYYLETLTATDPDTQGNTFVYKKGDDPGDWVKVDSKTGKITTNRTLDRESPFVKHDVYKVTVLAVDNGVPPMTGTGTLNIHLQDQNDNVPSLVENNMDMCLSDSPSVANITAFDLDGEPYGGPFRFELQGEVKGRWRLDPDHGYSVNLVKGDNVYAGHHELLLEVFDLQGHSALHNLSITVCNCVEPRMPNCRLRQAKSSRMGPSAIGMLLAAMLLLLGVLLLVFLLTCKKEFNFIPDEGSGEHLIKFNTELPGSDCKLPLSPVNEVDAKVVQNTQATGNMSAVKIKQVTSLNRSASMRIVRDKPEFSIHQQQTLGAGQFHRGNSVRMSATRKSDYDFTKSSTISNKYSQWESQSSTTGNKYSQWGNQISTTGNKYSQWGNESPTTGNKYSQSGNTSLIRYDHIFSTLNQRMIALQAPREELGDYAPYPYAEEGEEEETGSQLDAISIPETPFDPDMLLYLGPRFNTVASICLPEATIS